MINIKTLEDCVLYLTDKEVVSDTPLEKPDYNLFYSMKKQISNDVGFTNNQKNLIIRKITEKYKDHFSISDKELEVIMNITKNPIRVLNNVNKISLVNRVSVGYEPGIGMYFGDSYVKLEFSYNKKYLNKIQRLITSHISDRSSVYRHPHGTRLHYFKFDNKLIYHIVSEFKNTKLDISPELLDIHSEVQKILDNKAKYISSINANGVVVPSSIDSGRIKLFSNNNLIIADQHRRLGISLENNFRPSSLVEQIAYRKNQTLFANSEKFSIYEIAKCIDMLGRFPMLVILDSRRPYEILPDLHDAFAEFVRPEEQSVLFRTENKSDFNKYVHDKKINNFVDNNTKIVYISSKNLPKILLMADWKPHTCFQQTSFVHGNVDCYAKMCADLRFIYEKELSPFKKYKSDYEELQVNNTRRSKYKD